MSDLGRPKLPLDTIRLHRTEYMRKLRATTDYRQRHNQRRRWRYANDSEYRQRMKAKEVDPEHKRKTDISRRKKPIHFWVRNVREHHKRRGYIIEATFNEMVELCQNANTCKICGVDLSWDYIQFGIRARTQQSPSLDRIDNERIMTKDNMQILCLKCNVTKGDRTMRQFIEYCNNVVERFLIKEVMR